MSRIDPDGLNCESHASAERDTVIIDSDSTRRVTRFRFCGGPGCLSFHAEAQVRVTPYGEAMNGTGQQPMVVYRRRIAFDDVFEALPLPTEHSLLSSR